MNLFNFIAIEAVATLVIAYMAGWLVGFILWLVRYMVMELPDTHKTMRGGEKIWTQ